MKKILTILMLFLLISAFPYPMSAQIIPDPGLVTEISKISAIDNHAHPLRVVDGDDPDIEYDALNYHGTPLSEPVLPFRLRPPSEYSLAWQALYGDFTKEGLLKAKDRVRREQGDNYPAYVLDKLGIETMLANRVVMGRGLQVPRFRWVSYVDALMLPLNNEEAKRANSDYRDFYSSEERVLQHYLDDLGLGALPPTLDQYLTKVVNPTLERQKLDGAVAVKFEAAYLRALDFSHAPEVQAKHIYAHYVKGSEPPANKYKVLQDYLFRYIAREAGRLGLAVHIHTGLGIGGFFSVDGSHPLLLESLFNDPALRTTNFVLLHGGWPFAKQSAAMLLKPNVYADFSSLGFLIYPRELSEVIRSWLEIAPEKVMFGSDAIEVGSETVGWEELCWIGTNSARQALALALTGMKNDGQISLDQAVAFARMVLRENAIKLYNLTQ